MVNFPTSLDVLTNPAGGTALAGSHAAQHGAANDILEALEAKLGIGASTPTTVGDILTVIASGQTAYRALPVSTNICINGNYDVWQRTVAAAQTCTPTFNVLTSFGPDRMYTLPVGANVPVFPNTLLPPTGLSKTTCTIQGATSVTTCDHGQRIHAQHRHEYKTALVFRAWVYNAAAGGAAITPNLRIDTPAAANDWTTPTNRLDTALQSCPDATWTLVSALINPSAFTNIDNGLSAYLRFPSGALTAGKAIVIGQFSLSPGSLLLPYVAPDPEHELRRSEAYYVKTFPQTLAPNQATGNILGALYTVTPVGGAGSANVAAWAFPVTMAKTPAIVTFNPIAGNANWRNLSIVADSGIAVPVSIGDRGCFVFQVQVAGDVATGQCAVHATANAELI